MREEIRESISFDNISPKVKVCKFQLSTPIVDIISG
jgi:hypothetical protein